VHLARQGYTVVATDFVPAALTATKTRAAQAGVELEHHECDVIDYRAPTPFDIVLDSGCLHHLPRERVATYRTRLDEWLAPGGDYVLIDFAHPPRVRWIPKGPGHLLRDQAIELFTPLELQAYDETEFDVPFPMGRMRAGVYWFTRPTG
jgi:cyclopropane fatty-acyl-phospholipid synthase-like methyltransferase